MTLVTDVTGMSSLVLTFIIRTCLFFAILTWIFDNSIGMKSSEWRGWMWLAILIWMPVKYLYCKKGNIIKMLWPIIRSTIIVILVEFIPVIDIIEDIFLPIIFPLLVFAEDLHCMMNTRWHHQRG